MRLVPILCVLVSPGRCRSPLMLAKIIIDPTNKALW